MVEILKSGQMSDKFSDTTRTNGQLGRVYYRYTSGCPNRKLAHFIDLRIKDVNESLLAT